MISLNFMLKMKYLLLMLLTIGLYSCDSKAQNDSNKSEASEFEITKSEAEWKKELTPAEYQVLRKSATEPRNSSPLNQIDESGTFVCAACKNPIYNAKYKYDSGSGWPSFDRPFEGNIKLKTDRKLGYQRQEVICAKCGSHLGHVFNDGPKETTGKRHCINGVAMKFITDQENSK